MIKDGETKIDVLDHGYVLVVSHWGTDTDICSAARVSYAEGCKQVKDDASLIDYMMRHGHTSPFEQAFLKLEVKLPIFVEREWARHRTASWNEVSGRYSILPAEGYVPKPDRVRAQSVVNRQGSGGELPPDVVEDFIFRTTDSVSHLFDDYRMLLEAGVAREIARVALPLNTYTKKVWTIDLHNLLHFLKLRTAPTAMWEISQYADAIEGVVSELWPLTYASWRNHVKDAITFSADELRLIGVALDSVAVHGWPLAESFAEGHNLKGSRFREFAEKLARVG
jgi:thymidylate synthase (FAD)